MPETFEDRIARAIGDPSSIVPRNSEGKGEPYESVTRWSTRAVMKVLAEQGDVPGHECMYTRIFNEASKALDELLGPNEEDGCGQGLVAEIWHLARRCEHFEAEPEEVSNAG